MVSKIYWIQDQSLGTMARPRGGDWLEDEIRGLKMREVDCLISLLEPAESWELGLSREAEICEQQGISFLNFPIQDVGLPDDEHAFIRLVTQLSDWLKAGKRVVIHCRMGIGRASMVTAAVLIQIGFESEGIFELIGTYRGLNVPDTPGQKDWILARFSNL